VFTDVRRADIGVFELTDGDTSQEYFVQFHPNYERLVCCGRDCKKTKLEAATRQCNLVASVFKYIIC